MLERTTGSVYSSFDIIIKILEKKTERQNLRIKFADPAHVSKRVVQQIVRFSITPYTNAVEKQIKDGSKTAISSIDAGRFWLDVADGKVEQKTTAMSRAVLLFICVWIYSCASILSSFFRRCPHVSTPAVILLIGSSNFHHDVDNFMKFCQNGPITPLTGKTKVIVGATKGPAKGFSDQFSYHRFPLLHLLTSNLRRKDRWRAFCICLITPIWFFKALASSRLLLLLDPREFVWVALSKFLDEKKLIRAVVDTNSSFESQPLWAKGIESQSFKYHMVWYSQNFIPKVYSGESKIVSLPAARHMRVDVHWVWTTGFSNYLRSIGQRGSINAVGPLLWSLPAATYKRKSNFESRYLCLFDITPKKSSFGTFGAFKDYYSASTMKQFITDIFDCCVELEKRHSVKIFIKLKPKRHGDSRIHDQTYFKFIDSLAAREQRFTICSSGESLYELIGEADLSIAIPYTSTCYVAASIDRPSIYYDPFAELQPAYEKSPLVAFVSSKNKLLHEMQQALSLST